VVSPQRKTNLILAVLALAGLAACGLEDAIYSGTLHEEHARVPDPAPVRVEGHAGQVANGRVLPWSGSGEALESHAASIAADGAFSIEFSGLSEYRGVLLDARRGPAQRLGLVPVVPAQQRVTDPEIVLRLSAEHPLLVTLDARATTAVLALLARVKDQGLSLAAAEPSAFAGAMDFLAAALGPDGTGHEAGMMVLRIQNAADVAPASAPPPFDPGAESLEGLLSPDYLSQVPTDIDGDGNPDATGAALVAALLDLSKTLNLLGCYPPDRIRVVFQVEMGEGLSDGNCDSIDPFKFAVDEDGKTMFITGGVHKDTPRCETNTPAAGCLTEAQVDEASAALMSWVPNKLQMFDDGTHGDGVAGDGTFTIAVDLPYIPFDPADPAGAGLRLGYKYTWGFAGTNWTGAEEWPGNSRLLEVVDLIVDLNGDHLVVRRDVFGDEASNKDKANQRRRSRGGCGSVTWESERIEKCYGDSRENQIDTDGDCEDDAWPSPGSAVPITVPCPEGGGE
jgi:hypothetical protein